EGARGRPRGRSLLRRTPRRDAGGGAGLGRDTPVGGAMTKTEAAGLLRPEQAALVVVDLQEKLLPAIAARQRVLRNSVLLLRLADALSLPVVLTTQYRRGLGATVPEVTEAAPGVAPIDKVSFGCFGSPEFLDHVASLGRHQLVVAGIETHICVAQTV